MLASFFYITRWRSQLRLRLFNNILYNLIFLKIFMNRMILKDSQWDRIKHLLSGKSSDCGVTAADNRMFMEAVLWIARTGAPWRDLPDYFGH